MPINAGPEYFAAEMQYSKAKTTGEKIKALEEMIRTAPKHKSSEKLLGDLRKRLAKLKKERIKEQTIQSKKKQKVSLRKEGSAQVSIFGFTNSGKSSLLKTLTNANVEIGDYAYTTTEPSVGMMDYTGVKIQVIEIPSTFSPDVMSLLKTSDLLLILLDGEIDLERQLFELVDILEKNGIGNKKLLIVSNKRTRTTEGRVLEIRANTGENIVELKEQIWSRLGLIRVYTKSPNRPKATLPLTLNKGATIRDVTEQVHKSMLEEFRFARIFNETKYSGRKVGLDYELSDLDIVEIHSG